jgi:FkbM family methyltransferase
MIRQIKSNLRSFAGLTVRWILQPFDKEIIGKDRYGYDWMLDVARLQTKWSCDLNVIFDVGANTGATTRRLRKHFPSTPIIAFEPHPDTFKRLREQTQGLERLDLVEAALTSTVGRQRLHDYGQNSEINSLLPTTAPASRFGERPTRVIDVDCITIDRFCVERHIKEISLLKIDAEGADIDVLCGARDMLEERRIKLIYFEYNRVCGKDTEGTSLARIDALLQPYGYCFISSYTDYVVTDIDDEPFVIANALYALPPIRQFAAVAEV